MSQKMPKVSANMYVATDRNASSKNLVRRRKMPHFIRVLVALLGAEVLVAILCPVLATHSIAAQDLYNRLAFPSLFGGPAGHILGTDHLGRDLFSRLIFAIRMTFVVALLGSLMSSLLGLLLGLISGSMPGYIDTFIMFVVDARMAIPFIILALLFAAVFNPGVLTLILLIGLLGWAPYTRLVRGQILAIRERPFIEASNALGAGKLRIAVEHIVPNIISSFLVLLTMEFASIVIIESSLSYLGLGVQPPDVSLGLLVSNGRDYLMNAWWIALFPSVIIAAIMLEISLIGDWLRDRFDPRTAE
jgi:peptide/nickel transport system permease protein